MDKFEEFGKRIERRFRSCEALTSFEDFGKQVDEKLARVKQFVSEDVAPETEKRTASFCEKYPRTDGGGRMAEARNAARGSKAPKNETL